MHNGLDLRKKIPTPLHLPTYYLPERSNIDYFTLTGVCKRTEATEKELTVVALKENIDNALDFSEVNFQSLCGKNPEILDIKYPSGSSKSIISTYNCIPIVPIFHNLFGCNQKLTSHLSH
jgi:hypothetical protein